MSFKKSDTVRWGIIGVGNVTEVKSGPAFYKVPNSSLVAVMRRNKDKLADYARRHKVANYYTNASELINDPRVDAVYIATPPSSHAHYAIEAMRAGKPVYVEKPMAKTYAECMEMLKVSEEMQVPLFVAYYRRTLPAFLKVKNLIEEDTIGNPLFVNVKLYKQAEEKGQSIDEMHWHVFPEIAGAGHFYDLASHQFDFLDFIFGAVTNVKGMASNRASLYPAEDTVTASWQHESGVVGSGSWCFVVDKSSVDDEIKIVGEKGEISIPCFSHGKLKLTTEKGTTEMDFINPENISQNLVQQVVQELRGEGKCVSTGISAARSSWVLEEVVKNYYAK